MRMLSVSLDWRSLNIRCLSLAAGSAVIKHKDDSTCRDDDQRLSPPGSHRNEEANRYIILDWGMCVMKHREAYMMPLLRRAADWDLSDISCDPRQVAQPPVGRKSRSAVRQINFEELGTGQGVDLKPFLRTWDLSRACLSSVPLVESAKAIVDYAAIWVCACRMDAVTEQLQTLSREIADLGPNIAAAWDAYMNATDPQQKAELKERYDNLDKQLQECRSERRELRRELQRKLPSSGEPMA